MCKHYGEMFSSSAARILAGDLEIDAVLAGRESDHRRGMTLIARPSPNVRARACTLIEGLRVLEPDQYYYPPTDFHITVLPMFTATPQPGRFAAKSDAYEAVVAKVLKARAPIRVEFRGVTLSRAAVLIQGFPENGALNDLRENLRQKLRECGLGGTMDGRYKLQTAHMTVARFRAPLRNSDAFVNQLEAQRDRAFGTTSFRSFHLVMNDWYMRYRTLKRVKRYDLI